MELVNLGDDRGELFDGLPFPKGYRAEQTGIWLSITPPDGQATKLHQGWKLHISARPSSLKSTLRAVVPVLLDEGCDFKVAASPSVLRALNHGLYGAETIGKSITIYPNQERVKEIAHRLADALEGFEGPRIQSDRQVRENAPVYYRFGPFAPHLRIDNGGYLDIVLRAPDGRIASGRAGTRYSAPDWTEDPFAGDERCGTCLPKHDGAIMVGDHYRIETAIVRTFRGTTYRAVDVRTDQRVIIKSAVAFVNETPAGDARSYLRNEIRVLNSLAGIDEIPKVVDHFAYGDDEFLVTTELGSTNLRDDVVDNGLFTEDAPSQRNILTLAQGLLRLLDLIHERGIIYRDLAPKNVVLLSDGRWGLVDFELSRLDGVQLFGWTPGYSSKEQRSNEPASIVDDYYSLGATMFYAVAGIDPVIIDENPEINTARTLSCLSAICGSNTPIRAIVAGLLDSEPTARAGTAELLRTTKSLSGTKAAKDAPSCPPLGPLHRSTIDAITRYTGDLLNAGAKAQSFPPPVTAQVGTAGIVVESVLHPSLLAEAGSVARLTAQLVQKIDIPSGLLFGRMGVAIAIQTAANALNDHQLRQASEQILPKLDDLANEKRVDLAQGLAGLGVGYLMFAGGTSNSELAMSLANECADRLLRDQAGIEQQLSTLPTGNPAHAISIADGFAHGRAGIAYFLLAHTARFGEGESRERARIMIDALADIAPDLALRARSNVARPMCASWCQGLAGIGTTLLRGAYFFGNERYLSAAREAANGCLAIAARIPLVTQCCGLAGVGEFLLDLGVVTAEKRYRQHALDILGLMLIRSGGSKTVPRFPSSNLMDDAPGWANGTVGILAFLRRLIDVSTPRHWMADTQQLLPSGDGLRPASLDLSSSGSLMSSARRTA